MTQRDFEARHAQEDKLIELMKMFREIVTDMEPGDYYITTSISKNGQISIYTEGNRIDVTWFPDGQTFYTNDWDRMMGRPMKEWAKE